jgi:Icc protein
VTLRSARPLRLVQVSDCHVSADRSAAYRGQSADRNLASLLPAIRRWRPDLLLLTGDVSEDGSAVSYGRVAALLSTAGAPVLALPGNHDVTEVMRRYFPLGPWEGPLHYEARAWHLVLLDSTEPGRISGTLPPPRLAQLDECLSRSEGRQVLLALHHHPVMMASAWIDRYPLEQAEAFWPHVDRYPQVRCIAWGHVHQDFHAQRNGVALLGGPSSVANSLPQRPEFTLDLNGPACRWLELGADGAVETGLLRAG